MAAVRAALCATLLAAALATAGCGDQADSEAGDPPSGASDTTDVSAPADLCAATGPALSAELDLDDGAGSASDGVESCRFSSPDGTEVVVEVRPADGDLDAALRSACDDLGLVVEPRAGDGAAARCASSDDVTDERVLAAALEERDAVLVATLTSEDPDTVRLAGAELASVEAALTLA